MHGVSNSPGASLRAALRPVPPLGPEDSVRRFVSLARQNGLTLLPVTDHGRYLGVAALEDLASVLGEPDPEIREAFLRGPVRGIVRPAGAVAPPEMSIEQIGLLMAAGRDVVAPVVDDAGFCLGVVAASDLLVSDYAPPRPARIGGMATPFGVYLTDGSVRAGAGDLALVASGIAMSGLLWVAHAAVTTGVLMAHHYAHTPVLSIDDIPAGRPWYGVAAIGLAAVTTLVFLLLMRVTRLAGYHAAEHQTVHAVERGEPLVPEIVRRMPRAHPRCGTNLTAAGLLFFYFSQLFRYVPAIDTDSAYVIGAVATLFTWRSVGTFLQDRFTTRPASDRELASGIEAGSALLARYLTAPPSRPGLLSRLWCMGILQVLAGMCIALTAGWLLSLEFTLFRF